MCIKVDLKATLYVHLGFKLSGANLDKLNP